MSNLQPNCCLEFDFQKVDQHAGGKWLIHGTKRRKDNQLQSLKLPAEYPSWVARCDIKGSVSTVLNPIQWYVLLPVCLVMDSICVRKYFDMHIIKRELASLL